MRWEAERETVAAVNAPVTTALIASIAPAPGDLVLDLAALRDVAEAVAAGGARDPRPTSRL